MMPTDRKMIPVRESVYRTPIACSSRPCGLPSLLGACGFRSSIWVTNRRFAAPCCSPESAFPGKLGVGNNHFVGTGECLASGCSYRPTACYDRHCDLPTKVRVHAEGDARAGVDGRPRLDQRVRAHAAWLPRRAPSVSVPAQLLQGARTPGDTWPVVWFRSARAVPSLACRLCCSIS